MSVPATIAIFLSLFLTVGCLFVLTNLVVGRFLRPAAPNRTKNDIYECGETTIESGFLRFDMRFYIVALLFIVFEVEVAFFFPWANVFGKANHLQQAAQASSTQTTITRPIITPASDTQSTTTPAPAAQALSTPQPLSAAQVATVNLLYELGVTDIETLERSFQEPPQQTATAANQLMWICSLDLFLFLATLLVGFAYVWYRGDLNWVRSLQSLP